MYDTVVDQAGCKGSPDTLACLRQVNYETFAAAVNYLPGILGYRSLDLAYLPRPDPASNFFPVSPEIAVANGRFSRVPVIVGDQEDEGTLFSLFHLALSAFSHSLHSFSTLLAFCITTSLCHLHSYTSSLAFLTLLCLLFSHAAASFSCLLFFAQCPLSLALCLHLSHICRSLLLYVAPAASHTLPSKLTFPYV